MHKMDDLSFVSAIKLLYLSHYTVKGLSCGVKLCLERKAMRVLRA